MALPLTRIAIGSRGIAPIGRLAPVPKPRRCASASPSTRQISRVVASHSRAALSTTASSTGCRSVGEEAMTRSTSAVAVCCSSASVTWRLLS